MQYPIKSLLTLASAAAGVLLFAGCIASSDPQDGSAAAARAAAAAEPDQGGVAKVMVCHIPPGNPANRHTIVIGSPALNAHLAHGDKLGICLDGEGEGSLPPVSNEN